MDVNGSISSCLKITYRENKKTKENEYFLLFRSRFLPALRAVAKISVRRSPAINGTEADCLNLENSCLHPPSPKVTADLQITTKFIS